MTATEELRRLLDERGVEHYDGTERTLWGYEQTGENTGIYRFAASEISGGFLQFDMFRITPEQAVAATLGPGTGTCELIEFADVPFNVDYVVEGYDSSSGKDYAALSECSECGALIIEPPAYHKALTCDDDAVYLPYNYCPICGRKVEK